MCTGPRPDVGVDGTVQVVMSYLYDGELAQNVFHLLTTGGDPPTEQDLDAAAQLFDAWHLAELRPIQSAGAVLQKIIVTDLHSLSGLSKEYPMIPPRAGGVAQPQLPNSVTIAVKWSTARRGRSFRGRTFHIGLHEPQVVGNQLQAVDAAAMQQAYEALLDSVALSIDFEALVVVSYCGGGAWRNPPITTPITNVTVDPIIDSQRRRLPGRGS